MPSFDVVSEVDLHELANAVDQTNRELDTRFDFKGTGSVYELDGTTITARTRSEFQLQQMLDVLRGKLAKRGIDLGALDIQAPQTSLSQARQQIVVRRGLDAELSKKLVKDIKASKIKVQASIQGDKLRVSGKKRDDLQQAIALLKAGDYGLPLQYNNFRD